MKHIRLLKPWGVYPKSYVFTEMTGGQARTLIERGIAEYCDEEIKVAPVNRMMQASNNRRIKGRAVGVGS